MTTSVSGRIQQGPERPSHSDRIKAHNRDLFGKDVSKCQSQNFSQEEFDWVTG